MSTGTPPPVDDAMAAADLPAEPVPVSAAGSAVRSALLLGGFTVVFTALMALTYDATREPIKASVEARRLELIGQVLPPSEYDNVLLRDRVTLPALSALGVNGPVDLYRARLGERPVALVFETQAPDGYSGAIRLLMAVRADGNLAGVRVIAHKETPGLGDYIDPAKDRSRPEWIRQFQARNTTDAASWTVRKDGGDFTYRAGATISARAVIRAAGRAAAAIAPMRDALFALPAGADAREVFQ
ncbi:RnfABCDGE type electron transport complex subunit G [Methyloversatilis thermotolerans]|uniref:RnfABCDGE type electron transport complex subunit G n=1 Tax=Methyloversatilis thermotolerans TaxID=1346290 RepID=UPI001E594818|nr:RnfABCDGE type electron transport complex subunit G [Methyloversatilis thermotolerans]